jgi:hypothetical protein
VKFLIALLLGLLGIGWWEASGTAAGDDKGSSQGTLVTIDKLKSKTPADWKPEKPANRLRSYQFRLPRAREDKEDAQLAILPELTGNPEQNVQRWKDMFVAPDGKTLDEVARVDKLKIGPVRVTYLDVQGTYLYTDRPMAPRSTAKPLPGYRMLAVMLQSAEGASLIRLVGPAATVAAHKAAFDAWLKNFK